MKSRSRGWLSGLALLALSSAAPARTVQPVQPVLPFLHDDYPRALAEARARHLPIFVEAWAPW